MFSRTVSEVSAVSSNEIASAQDLSAVISQDASMTARLLRIANSLLFNPQNRSVDTVSAAVIMLGFDVVRELAVSLALIEQVLKGHPHERVTQGLARAFHAAAQAKSFARLRRDRRPEEVFVAALLYQIGDLSFWSTEGTERERVEKLMARGVDTETAEKKVLGFSLQALSRRLVVDWNLGDLLKDTLDGKVDAGGRSSHISLGHSLARTIEVHGREAAETQSVIRRLAAHLNVPVERVVGLVDENLGTVLRIARCYGVYSLETVLPLSESALAAVSAEEAAIQAQEESTPVPLAERQLVLLGKLATAIEAGGPLDVLMQQLLTGVHEGIGFDRTYFALLSPDRRSLQAKYTLGANPAGFDGSRRALKGAGDFFQSLFDIGRVGRYHPGDKAADTNNMGWLTVGECLCMPVSISGKPIGILYADRSKRREPISDDVIARFRLFGLQIPLILSQVRKAA